LEFSSWLAGLVLLKPALQESDGGEEVVVEREEQVDVVEVFLAREAVGQRIQSRIDETTAVISRRA
jgi:hypothetical protein